MKYSNCFGLFRFVLLSVSIALSPMLCPVWHKDCSFAAVASVDSAEIMPSVKPSTTAEPNETSAVASKSAEPLVLCQDLSRKIHVDSLFSSHSKSLPTNDSLDLHAKAARLEFLSHVDVSNQAKKRPINQFTAGQCQ